MVKKTQRIKGKNPTFLVFLHPDLFLPYVYFKILYSYLLGNYIILMLKASYQHVT